MPVHDHIRSDLDCLVHFFGHEQSAERQVACAQAFGERNEIGGDAFLFTRVATAGAPHPAHHFVEDEQHAIAVADLADAREITWNRRDAAERRANDGFGYKGGHRVATERKNLGFELVCNAFSVIRFAFAFTLPAIGETRRDMVSRLEKQRFEHRATADAAARGQHPRGGAVITMRAPDDMTPLGLASLDEILPRELESRFDRFRTAAREPRFGEARRRIRYQIVGKRFHGLVRKKTRVRKFEMVDLGFDRIPHPRIAVAETRNGGAAGSIEITLALRVDQIDAVAFDGHGKFSIEAVAVESACHAGRQLSGKLSPKDTARVRSPPILTFSNRDPGPCTTPAHAT